MSVFLEPDTVHIPDVFEELAIGVDGKGSLLLDQTIGEAVVIFDGKIGIVCQSQSTLAIRSRRPSTH